MKNRLRILVLGRSRVQGRTRIQLNTEGHFSASRYLPRVCPLQEQCPECLGTNRYQPISRRRNDGRAKSGSPPEVQSTGCILRRVHCESTGSQTASPGATGHVRFGCIWRIHSGSGHLHELPQKCPFDARLVPFFWKAAQGLGQIRSHEENTMSMNATGR